ncbi:MAG: hypothetical protein DMF68_02625 [Acidobacteria bacterium]|nr:MAG: hypothetical protein DMF68_02625 [Acidobacteriota bacterium]
MPTSERLSDYGIKPSVEPMTLNSKSGRLLYYAAAVVLVAVAALFADLLWPLVDRAASALFLAAIMIAAFYGGFGPGLFATLLSLLAMDYFFVPPFYKIELTLANLIRAGVFTAVSILISWLNASRKKLMERIREREQEREALLKQISGFNVELRQEVDAATRELSTANSTLLQTQQRLTRSERLAAVGQMAASLAHDIGTPLNAISGHLKLLARNHPADDDTRRRVKIINKQLDSIVATVKNLLERTHKREFALRPTDLNTLIREMFWLVSPMLDKHGITASINLDTDLPDVEADRDSLQQVFMNIINNSVEAMPEGGRIEIISHLNRNKGLAELTFHDTGVGIDPEILDHLFEPMRTSKASGSGFGLAIAREIMTAHYGRIEVLKDQKRGASFHLTFPLSVEAQPSSTIESVTTNAV